VPELCWAFSLIFVDNDSSCTDGGGAELRQLETTDVDAAKIQLELIEFQHNVAVKEIFFVGTPENLLSKESISKFFSTPLKLSVEILTVFRSTCCYLRGQLSPASCSKCKTWAPT